jgi:hypothetical protein
MYAAQRPLFSSLQNYLVTFLPTHISFGVQCFDGCCNCLAATCSYCCVVILLVQIPLVFVIFLLLNFGDRANDVIRGFSSSELLLAWAASVLLGR